jgi:2-phosphoglycerate kinase
MKTKVFLIGGAPGAGKSTLGTALAARLGIGSLTIDDLVTAVQAVTTPETHPGLHLMWNTSHLEYFTYSSIDKLKGDAIRQHEAAWPFIERVIRKHALGGAPIVIDGWHLWPERISQLQLENVWAGWIIIAPSVLEERERKNVEWLQGSSDPERMFANFMSRSLWFNGLMEEQANEFQMITLSQHGETSVDELCEMLLEDQMADN